MNAYFETSDDQGSLRFEVTPEGVGAQLTGETITFDAKVMHLLVDFLNENLEPRRD